MRRENNRWLGWKRIVLSMEDKMTAGTCALGIMQVRPLRIHSSSVNNLEADLCKQVVYVLIQLLVVLFHVNEALKSK